MILKKNIIFFQLTHKSINPSGILAIGPTLDFNAPHNRAQMQNSGDL